MVSDISKVQANTQQISAFCDLCPLLSRGPRILNHSKTIRSFSFQFAIMVIPPFDPFTLLALALPGTALSLQGATAARKYYRDTKKDRQRGQV